MCICMKQMEREEKLPHGGGGSSGGLIGPQNVPNSNFMEFAGTYQ